MKKKSLEYKLLTLFTGDDASMGTLKCFFLRTPVSFSSSGFAGNDQGHTAVNRCRRKMCYFLAWCWPFLLE